MRRTTGLCLTLLLAAGQTTEAAGALRNVALEAKASAQTAAGAPGAKYSMGRLNDGDVNAHWASRTSYKLPHWLKLQWARPVTVDTIVVDVYASRNIRLYAFWKQMRVELDGGVSRTVRFEPNTSARTIVRFDKPVRTRSVRVRVEGVYEPKTYLGCNEIEAYLDPKGLLKAPRRIVRAKPREALKALGRPEHPIVYMTRADVARGRRNAETTTWGKKAKQDVLKAAAKWLEHDEAYWLEFLPEPGACYAYGFTGCPICNSRCGTWAGARCSWDRPRTLTCSKGHVLPDKAHPDDGAGFVGPDKRVHYIIGSWNAWVTEQWTRKALPSLAHAYTLTGDEKYAERAAFFLDALASIYAESTSGSWDYPSRPPSGRFARPWYQVARNLVVYVEAYDLIYSSRALDKPSLRPQLERHRPKGPTVQKRAVGTPDAKGWSQAGMTRRRNIDVNLVQDGAYYCYKHTFKGMLHNGHADYMRGALAAGALLGIPEYVHNAVESPYSIYAMLANNSDRDGRYYETAMGYALHARNLYLTFVEPLRYWRCKRYPKGVDLFADARMRSFYQLPDLVMAVAGHTPNFGDCGPDNRQRFPSNRPFSSLDHQYAEWLRAGSSGSVRQQYDNVLAFLCRGDVDRVRNGAYFRRWLLYRAGPVDKNAMGQLDADFQQRVFGSWFLGQKGIGILRDGGGQDAQGALMRFGPSLNHGDKDDLGLLYYGKGWQLTYEIGYGLGSTHTQVGWGSQTASHTIVTVNEASQSGGAQGGSGGSLHLFADVPGLKVMEADSPLSYAAQGVTQYRRTVALVGLGRDQYLVDLFRVRGGKQHDYNVGVQSQQFEVGGVKLGPEEEGSLAGKENAWGERQGPDGDIKGYPSKPYWNPPPGNGYGFFYDARRGPAGAPCWVDWPLGGRNAAHLRVHVLPEPTTELIVAKAPGLYPHFRNSSYVIARRKGESLTSAFASVMAPYARPFVSEGLDCHELSARLADSSAEVKLLGSYQILLLRAAKAGDHMTFEIQTPDAGPYTVTAGILRSPAYGRVRLLVDGRVLGEVYDAANAAISGPETVRFGTVNLSAGKHAVRLEMAPDTQALLVGLASLSVKRAGQAKPKQTPAEPKPIVASAERVPVEGGVGDVAPLGVHVRRASGCDEYLLSADLDDSEKRARTAAGEVCWRGALVFLAVKDGRVESVATHGAWDVRVGGKRVGPEQGVMRGTVTNVDYDQRWVDVDATLPATQWRGHGLYFSNPKYSRNTAYRIYGVTRSESGTRFHLGPQPMLLGQGRVHQLMPGDEVQTDIPHEYCRSVVGRYKTRFFDGKLMRSSGGAATCIKTITFGSPMKIAVESIDGFNEGETLFYYDVQKGDAVAMPLSWSSRP